MANYQVTTISQHQSVVPLAEVTYRLPADTHFLAEFQQVIRTVPDSNPIHDQLEDKSSDEKKLVKPFLSRLEVSPRHSVVSSSSSVEQDHFEVQIMKPIIIIVA
ncbi:hypothetical protein PGT21_028870 [Puccinia graminis f. sp. tritici]|uniref:Uncharacterized protein n=1 Tax=Puccinia graminis f. sp. tritici TaxID=56615 RepID=A0A5B0NFL3_PUCGR|nr:hypothetical protein PGT21_028870 [Puccinia graminis f. sp. tritici]